MKQSRWSARTVAAFAHTSAHAAVLAPAFVAALACSAAAFGQTKSAPSAPPDSHAPMAKPPEAASGAGGASNPDNMPIKRPDKPTNDHMSHPPPASGANAK
ncbi:hypothetical protein LJ656_01550 [Paraburkholderia sp. MMS20-SJTR3]|uniref:Lipoprotein n=1 Tax=Paraburkholderia sejongensis TaxID=2886946 RepID=A0ABS8JN05_9BURK|nr:hypothetical protein [Paraburkholderia sp. MMS20-SJTR3]MCC8391259.1 hypothetical protein [Paraburkholderia sp. MMS20-SJTR3]